MPMDSSVLWVVAHPVRPGPFRAPCPQHHADQNQENGQVEASQTWEVVFNPWEKAEHNKSGAKRKYREEAPRDPIEVVIASHALEVGGSINVDANQEGYDAEREGPNAYPGHSFSFAIQHRIALD